MTAIYILAILLLWLGAGLLAILPLGLYRRAVTRAAPVPANDNEPPQRRGIAS